MMEINYTSLRGDDNEQSCEIISEVSPEVFGCDGSKAIFRKRDLTSITPTGEDQYLYANSGSKSEVCESISVTENDTLVCNRQGATTIDVSEVTSIRPIVR